MRANEKQREQAYDLSDRLRAAAVIARAASHRPEKLTPQELDQAGLEAIHAGQAMRNLADDLRLPHVGS